MTLSEITREVACRLSVKRFSHSLSVAAQAVKLSQIHKEDPVKAYTAAILHDIAREQSSSQWLEWAERHGSDYDRYRNPPVLLHGCVGEEIARRDFFISDLDVLEAIRYHTSGFPGMGRQAQILFIADYISRDRNFIDEEFRNLVYRSSLSGAAAAVAETTVSYFRETGRSVHRDTEDLLNFLRRKS